MGIDVEEIAPAAGVGRRPGLRPTLLFTNTTFVALNMISTLLLVFVNQSLDFPSSVYFRQSRNVLNAPHYRHVQLYDSIWMKILHMPNIAA